VRLIYEAFSGCWKTSTYRVRTLRLVACERGRLGGGGGVLEDVPGIGVLGRDAASGGATFERTRMGGPAFKSIAEVGRAGGGAELAPLA